MRVVVPILRKIMDMPTFESDFVTHLVDTQPVTGGTKRGDGR